MDEVEVVTQFLMRKLLVRMIEKTTQICLNMVISFSELSHDQEN